MGCDDTNRITIVRGNDTDFNEQVFVTLRLTTEILDLSKMKASLSLNGIVKRFDDLSSGEIHLNYTAAETASMPFGDTDGVLKLYDEENKIATIESKLPFRVISVVHGNAIAVTPAEINIDVKQGGENILNVSVEAGVTVAVGTTTTLPEGSDATVVNVGTENHLVLNFGIPRGDTGNGIQNVEKIGTVGLVDTYRITYTDGNHFDYQITNGNGIQKIEKTSTSGLVDTYTITYTNGTTSTYQITNGKDATINGYNAITLSGGNGVEVVNNGSDTIVRGKMATNSSTGVVTVADWSGLKIQNQTGVIYTDAATTAEVAAKSDTAKPLTPFVVDDIVKAGLIDNSLTLSNSQKNAACSWLGALRVTTNYGASFEMSLNTSNYKLTATLKDQHGNTLGSAQVIDLPLESMVVSGYYDSINKQLVLVLQNGNTITIPVADLISGLQTTITGAATTITDNNLTSNRAVISNGSGKIAVSNTTSTELGYLSGVTSNVQTQLNGKQPVGSYATTTQLSDGLATKIDKGYAVNDFASNCITEIPQDINLVLSSGTLTVKAGSIITYPDGTQLSNAQDRSVTHSGTGQLAIFVNQSANAIVLNTLEKCYSGANPPAGMVSGSHYIWYDTTNGLVKRTNDAGSTWTSGFSLPIGIVTVSGGAISSIDQVFNGAGYVGHHAFVLPDVKGLAPNGKNSDGTLKSSRYSQSVLSIIELTTGIRAIGCDNNLTGAAGWARYVEVDNIYDYEWQSGGDRVYEKTTNKTYMGGANVLRVVVPIVLCGYNGTTVTKFDVRPVSGLSANYINTALGLTASKAVVTDSSGNVGTSPTTSTEIGYLAGVTSPIQTQINARPTTTDVNTALAQKIDKGYAVNDFATNCLVEVPQDLKLELSSGTLTLKAGSVVTFADGTQYSVAEDRTLTFTTNGKWQVVATNLGVMSVCNFPGTSGSTEPSEPIGRDLWYDTANNVCKRWNGAIWENRSFPLCLITVSGGAITSIDQVFNGLGFVGLKVFCLPDVRAYIANGRNADGTLDSLDITTTALAISSNDGTDRTGVYLQNTGVLNRVAPSFYSFSVKDNIYTAVSDGSVRYILKVADVTFTGGVITSMNVIPVSALASDYVNKALGLTASKAVVTDASGNITATSVTATELGYLSGTTSPIQTQLGGKQATPSIVTLTGNDSVLIADNTIYNNASTQSSLSITLPLGADVSFICEFDFSSGTTPTVFAANSVNISGDECVNGTFTPVANKRYTLMIYYNGASFCGVVKGV